MLLRGKHKPTFAPHVDTGDFVIIVNAAKVALTGNKREQKMYTRHSGFPGGLRQTPYTELLATEGFDVGLTSHRDVEGARGAADAVDKRGQRSFVEQFDASAADPAVREFNTRAARAWGEAQLTAGDDAALVEANVAATTGFYVPPAEG